MANAAIDITPKEFCRALWELKRFNSGPTMPQGIRTLQLGIICTHFIRGDYGAAEFVEMLEEMVADDRPRRILMRECAKEMLRYWRTGRWHRLPDGTVEILDPPRRRRA